MSAASKTEASMIHTVDAGRCGERGGEKKSSKGGLCGGPR